ncbi:glutamine cyclotransferase [Achromobacter sp. Marseille-Q4962]|jgi:glutamine cyclotransferase|uniref:Vgb family protein n=1 Tax=Achromobacter sp. Marseille-Q4962 TaxID=2942202 RepID=UPI002073717F|nr:glutamine cyclotransferase [Achromobacter sp. Marseille-Q4962]
MNTTARIIREYGPFPGVDWVHGVSWDGESVWLAVGDRLAALDPASGSITRALAVEAQAGTAFDGRHLYQISGGRILKLDPATGETLASIPAPEGGDGNSGLAWAEGSLWVGRYRDREILRLDPATGDVLRRIASRRYVTGVTWAEGELWHGTWEDGASDLRRIDPESGEALQTVALPEGLGVSGLEWDGAGLFYCGGGDSGRLRAVQRPARR